MSLTTDRHDGGHDDLTRRGNITWRGCCSATSSEVDHVKDDERDSSGANYAGPRRRYPGAPPHYPPRTYHVPYRYRRPSISHFRHAAAFRIRDICARETGAARVCVFYGSTGRGTRTGARVGDAQQTRRSHARSCTHKSSIPSQCPVFQHPLSKHPVPVLLGYEDEARKHGTLIGC
jgi:hypothetical protein